MKLIKKLILCASLASFMSLAGLPLDASARTYVRCHVVKAHYHHGKYIPAKKICKRYHHYRHHRYY